jgi:hypothetical membrane protein
MNRPDAARSLPAQVRDLCLLRGDPQDLPFSLGLLVALLVAGTALDVVVGNALDDDGNALARSLLSSLVVFGLCWVALAMRDLRNRFVQTATALAATGIAFTLLQGGLLLLVGPFPESATTFTPTQVIVGWLLFATLLWQIAVTAHIVRHAADMRPGFALALAITWFIASMALQGAAFGAN